MLTSLRTYLALVTAEKGDRLAVCAEPLLDVAEHALNAAALLDQTFKIRGNGAQQAQAAQLETRNREFAKIETRLVL